MKSLLLIAFLICIQNILTQFTCTTEYGSYPDPADCSKFYICDHFTANHMSCASGLYYSPTIQTCDWPQNVNCNGNQVTTPSTTTIKTTTKTTTTSTTTSNQNLVYAKADLTNFESYPDPNSEECIEFNGCLWEGQFAFVDGKKPESWVQANNIIAVHSKDAQKYKLKTFRIKQGSKQIDAKVYDYCSDSDCDGCCTQNCRNTGFLIDMEKYTMQRFGSGSGIVDWTCLDC